MVVCDRYDFLALLVFIPRVPNAISPFFATVAVGHRDPVTGAEMGSAGLR
jgi:hypothetical protein